MLNEQPNTENKRENFAVIPFSLTQIEFNETAVAVANIACDFKFLVRLFTNVNFSKSNLTAAFGKLVLCFRYIVNNKLRYQQRRDNIPASFGIRFFGALDVGGGYYSPYLGLLCSDVLTIEFIIREWCIYTEQFPHCFTASFGSVEAAKAAKAADSKAGKRRAERYIDVDYNNSNPFRLQWYLNQTDLDAVNFGSVASIYFAESCYFEGTNYIRLPYQKITICGLCGIKGRRAYQHWGAIKSSKPAGCLLKRRRTSSSRSTNPAHIASAKRYYQLAGMSKMGFSPFVYHHIKYKYDYDDKRAAYHQIVIQKYMETLEDCMSALEDAQKQIEELKKRLNE